jgi:hypothetical protein
MSAKLIAALGVGMAMLPAAAFGQAADVSLRDAIQASVMNDPRVSEIPPAQLTALIDALYAEAQAQSMSASDILWQPQNAAVGEVFSGTGAAECASGWEGYLCQFEHTFGFAGSNYELPIIVLVVSGLLILVLWELIAHHRKKPVSEVVSVAQKSVPPPPNKVQ